MGAGGVGVCRVGAAVAQAAEPPLERAGEPLERAAELEVDGELEDEDELDDESEEELDDESEEELDDESEDELDDPDDPDELESAFVFAAGTDAEEPLRESVRESVR
jgi:hypothetical protein